MASVSDPASDPGLMPSSGPLDESEVLVIDRPEPQTLPVVFASPHSGNRYPESFIRASRLDPAALRKSEDSFVDEIYAAAPRFGAPLIKALFPRAYMDPNREPFELDPEMFDDELPSYVNANSPRVAAGLGTIARVVANGENIYRNKLSFTEAANRINTLYRPYHRALQDLIETTRRRFGWCLLIDCHSMPSIGGPMDLDSGKTRVDFVLGDCFGISCAPAIADHFEAALARDGHAVTRNDPYSGGYTTVHYGRPDAGVHALQIEINRALYMDEIHYTRLPGLETLRRHMEALMATLPALCDRLKPS